eukprot:tig00021135_g18938.t1
MEGSPEHCLEAAAESSAAAHAAGELPLDVVAHILSFLSFEGRSYASLVSRAWHAAAAAAAGAADALDLQIGAAHASAPSQAAALLRSASRSAARSVRLRFAAGAGGRTGAAALCELVAALPPALVALDVVLGNPLDPAAAACLQLLLTARRHPRLRELNVRRPDGALGRLPLALAGAERLRELRYVGASVRLALCLDARGADASGLRRGLAALAAAGFRCRRLRLERGDLRDAACLEAAAALRPSALELRACSLPDSPPRVPLPGLCPLAVSDCRLPPKALSWLAGLRDVVRELRVDTGAGPQAVRDLLALQRAFGARDGRAASPQRAPLVAPLPVLA